MTEFISRKYGNEGYEVIIKTDCHEHYRASEEFARRLIDHEKPVTDTNAGKWIPVSERLPETQEEVLTYSECNDVRAGSLIVANGETMLWYLCRTDKLSMAVTHWMPLPEPPKEGE